MRCQQVGSSCAWALGEGMAEEGAGAAPPELSVSVLGSLADMLGARRTVVLPNQSAVIGLVSILCLQMLT